MIDQKIECRQCGHVIARITGFPGSEQTTFPEDVAIKRLHDGLYLICPKCGAATEADQTKSL